MQKALIFIFLLSHQASFSQLYGEQKIAIINDPDGYIFIRNGQGINFNVVDTLIENEFFLFVPNDSSNWYSVYKMWNIQGFVHKSRIKDLKGLSLDEQRDLIDSIFNLEIKLHKDFFNKNKPDQKLASEFHEEKFDPILDLFVNYMSKNFDENLMRKFFEVLIVESGSADELPSWAIGFIYLTRPDELIFSVKECNNIIINRHLEFGFSNVTYGKESQIRNYQELNEKINEL